MVRLALSERQRRQLLDLASHHGMSNVRVFGSVSRGEARPDSDIDLLVDVESGRSLLDLVGFAQDAEVLLNRKVDVVSSGGISPWMRDTILREALPL
ncbi:MAG: nucleotidyltransferase family protein [Gemmatimonadota bacterium]|nr:nucleotidyltransferase family protein [Gemmatimonadota bacterium]